MNQSRLFILLIIFISNQALANSFKTEKWLTKNAVPVIFYPAKEVPMLDISLAFAAGSAYDGNQYGLSTLTANLINQGNAGQDATAIGEALAETGAQFQSEVSRDMVVFNLRSLSDNKPLEQSLKIFSQIINHPDFPDTSFERQKKQILMSIEQSKESPDDVANLEFFKKIYGDHPYAHPTRGTPDTLKALNKSQVQEFYKHYYVANRAIIVIVGAVDSQFAHRIAEDLSQNLGQGEKNIELPKAASLTQAEQVHIPFPSSQTIIRLGQIGIDHQNPYYFPLLVGNYILGGGSLVSRLALEVREQRGLTYGVSSEIVPMPGRGPFLISLSTKNEDAAKALKITQDTLKTFVQNGPTEKELKAAKLYITGSYPLSLSSNQSIASLLLRIAFYHLPDNYLESYVAHINAVTQEQIKQAFKETIDPNKLTLVTVGPS